MTDIDVWVSAMVGALFAVVVVLWVMGVMP